VKANTRSGPGTGAIEDFGCGVDDEVDDALAMDMQGFEASDRREGREGNGQSNESEALSNGRTSGNGLDKGGAGYTSPELGVADSDCDGSVSCALSGAATTVGLDEDIWLRLDVPEQGRG